MSEERDVSILIAMMAEAFLELVKINQGRAGELTAGRGLRLAADAQHAVILMQLTASVALVKGRAQ